MSIRRRRRGFTAVISAPAVAPAIITAPVISGNTLITGTLTVDTGSWNNLPSSFAYQWKRDAVDVAGATTNSYAKSSPDQDKVITCLVTATNGIGSTGQISNSIGPIIAAPVGIGAPTISGGTTVGAVLTVSGGSWTGSTGTLTYQWKRNGVAITGATANTYTLVTADIGATITCTVTRTNIAGSASQTSAGIGPVTALAPTGSAFLSNSVSVTSFVTAHNIVLPSVINAGSTIVLICFPNNQTITVAPSGFTLVSSDVSQALRCYVYKKVADGTEAGTTVTYTTSGNCSSVDHAYALTLESYSVQAFFAPGPQDPPSTGALASDTYVYIAASDSNRNDNNCVIAGSPAEAQGFTGFLYAESGNTNSTSQNAISAASAYVIKSASTGIDPDKFTWSGSVTTLGMGVTVACRVGNISGSSASDNTLDFSNTVNSQYLGSIV